MLRTISSLGRFRSREGEGTRRPASQSKQGTKDERLVKDWKQKAKTHNDKYGRDLKRGSRKIGWGHYGRGSGLETEFVFEFLGLCGHKKIGIEKNLRCLWDRYFKLKISNHVVEDHPPISSS